MLKGDGKARRKARNDACSDSGICSVALEWTVMIQGLLDIKKLVSTRRFNTNQSSLRKAKSLIIESLT